MFDATEVMNKPIRPKVPFKKKGGSSLRGMENHISADLLYMLPLKIHVLFICRVCWLAYIKWDDVTHSGVNSR